MRTSCQALEEAFQRYSPTPDLNGEGRGGEGRGGEGREGKGREGKGREGKGREGKGREGKGREGKGREGEGFYTYSHCSTVLSQSPFSPRPVPFSEMTEVRLHTVSLYTSLELVLEGARSLQVGGVVKVSMVLVF